MRNRLAIPVLILTAIIPAACSETNPFEQNQPSGDVPVQPGDSSQTGSETTTVSGLALSFDYSTLSESETIPDNEDDALYDDYVENTVWKNFYTITYSDGAATVYSDNPDAAIEISVDGANVTVNASKKAQYTLEGTASNGSFKIYSDSKFELVLNGLSLANTSGAAINSQSKKRMFVTCAAGTENVLCDGTSYTDCGEEDMKGTLFSEGQIIFGGSGTLSVTGQGKNAIVSDQYICIRKNTDIRVSASAGHGIKADNITVEGGVQNISVTSTAGKGIKAESTITFNAGRTTVINTGSTGSSSNSGTGGGFGPGGMGHGGGFGGGESSTSLPKGIKADTLITVNGGDIRVQCTNGEGIESKISLDINGGDVFSYCSDDAVNTGGRICVTGGRLYAFSTGNDAIDSNYGRSGAFTISGGIVAGLTSKGGVEEGLDCDNNSYIIINGGYVFTAGGQQGNGQSGSSSSVGSAQQGYTFASATFTAGKCYTLADSNGNNIFSFALPVSISSTLSLISAQEMKKGSAYTVKSGSTLPSDATSSFHNFWFGSTSSGSDSCLSFTAK